MIASSSLSTEIDIFLSDGEVSRLERETIQGELVFRNREGKVCNRKPIEIAHAYRNNGRYWLDLITIPAVETDFQKIEGYKILIYPEGYQRLKENGYAGERIGAISRVDIFRE